MGLRRVLATRVRLHLVLICIGADAARGALLAGAAAAAAGINASTSMEQPDWAWEISNHGRECFDASAAHKPAGMTLTMRPTLSERTKPRF